ILDVACITEKLKEFGVSKWALKEYDRQRVKATTDVVLLNRSAPPDTVLKEVHERTGGAPFERIEDVISRDELLEITNRYKSVAGFKIEDLQRTD
ncbi:MAG TPA: flavin-dependent oxidoreductase, partial [Pusillimonas sp.]|nr:flavin-dependent oxidoreductase [Pusillimonas sp.]